MPVVGKVVQQRQSVSKGENPELLSEAINSLLVARGYHPHGEGYYESQIEIIEEDDFGRKLFSYFENCFW